MANSNLANDVNMIKNFGDEQIKDVTKRIETFQKSNELFDGYYNHIKRPRGAQTWQSRKVVKPKVANFSELNAAQEAIAPRSQKFSVETFEHKVLIYRDKIKYTAEDIMYGYDNLVKIAGDTLAELNVQYLDWLKVKPLVSSKAIFTPVQDSNSVDNVLLTLDKLAVIIKKNQMKPWEEGKFLFISTPEVLTKLRKEIQALGDKMSEPTKKMVESQVVGSYGIFMFRDIYHEGLYKSQNVNYIAVLGRKPNGESPLDCAEMDGIEVIHNPLGSGLLEDVDGKLTSDDNKQIGSVAMNINGLGTYVNDDLCLLNGEFTLSSGYVAPIRVLEDDKTGFVSGSQLVEITATAGTNTAITLDGVISKIVSGSTKYYAIQNTIFKATVAATDTHTLATSDKWKTADFVGCDYCEESTEDDATIYVRVKPSASAITIKTNAAAS